MFNSFSRILPSLSSIKRQLAPPASLSIFRDTLAGMMTDLTDTISQKTSDMIIDDMADVASVVSDMPSDAASDGSIGPNRKDGKYLIWDCNHYTRYSDAVLTKDNQMDSVEGSSADFKDMDKICPHCQISRIYNRVVAVLAYMEKSDVQQEHEQSLIDEYEALRAFASEVNNTLSQDADTTDDVQVEIDLEFAPSTTRALDIVQRLIQDIAEPNENSQIYQTRRNLALRHLQDLSTALKDWADYARQVGEKGYARPLRVADHAVKKSLSIWREDGTCRPGVSMLSGTATLDFGPLPGVELISVMPNTESP
ncbi:hypothetical protein F5Y16DRAFT_382898 [Xylariaceae sp. FL0255]|nr:hypothetical protein F5Y16DRAFT_382898 [Xylariaceae sp. FL0255]